MKGGGIDTPWEVEGRSVRVLLLVPMPKVVAAISYRILSLRRHRHRRHHHHHYFSHPHQGTILSIVSVLFAIATYLPGGLRWDGGLRSACMYSTVLGMRAYIINFLFWVLV